MQAPLKSRRPLILVVEDDQHIRELVLTRLSLGGYDAIWARDGAEGLRMIVEHRPAAVVLDVNMPRVDGFELLAHLKTYKSVANTPVLVLTARNSSNDLNEAIKLGARDFLVKPFEDRKLIRRIQRLLRGSAQGPNSSEDDTVLL